VFTADPDEAPEIAEAGRDLLTRLNLAFTGKRWHGGTLPALREAIAHHLAACRRRGVRFPTLTVLPFPRLGTFQLVRADLDEASIRTLIVNLALNLTGVTMLEVARAVAYAFPGYRPGARTPDLPQVTLRSGEHWS
jgi:hypothetical protein